MKKATLEKIFRFIEESIEKYKLVDAPYCILQIERLEELKQELINEFNLDYTSYNNFEHKSV